MSHCDNCGFSLPQGAAFCPHCGAPVKKETEVSIAPIGEPIGRLLQAGVVGAFLSVMIRSFSPQDIDLYFIPSFLSALIAIYFSKSRRLGEAVTIALVVYLFADAIVTGLALGSLYLQDVPIAEIYGNYVPSLVDVIMYAASPITAVVAGYIGARLTSRAQVGKQPPVTHRREEEPGGIIYSLRRDLEKMLTSNAHKV